MTPKIGRKVLAYELVGIVFIIILGSILHFTFEWSNNSPVVGAFSAVNESVWEHLKLALFPTILFALIEYAALRSISNNFAFAKTVGVYVMVAIIPAIFYTYTAFTGESIFAIDISSFIVAIIVGQLVSLKLLTYKKLPQRLNWGALFFVILLAVVFIVFTYLPPQAPILKDPITGQYGIPKLTLLI